MGFEQKILAAQGYCELGLYEEGLSEIDGIEPHLRNRPEILEVRLLILMRAKRWVEALDISNQLCVTEPQSTAGFVHAAFCLHELGRTGEAIDVLLAGPPALREEPTVFYNLACYEAALGRREEAVENLRRSFKMDKKFREFAKADPDLDPIRDLL
ncbi:MAG: tetratricopeptide repeat protein [Verrucomicrobiota bacterium]|nr:tetratricopeptide repeat protein [Verrucomicrobiota bacterium]